MARHNLKRTAPQYAGLQSCSQTPIHARSKTANGAPSSKSSSVGTLGPVAAQGRTGGGQPLAHALTSRRLYLTNNGCQRQGLSPGSVFSFSQGGQAPCGDRTHDHTLTKRMLCQLS